MTLEVLDELSGQTALYSEHSSSSQILVITSILSLFLGQ